MADGKIEIDTSINTDGVNKGVKNVSSSLDKLKGAVKGIGASAVIAAEVKALKGLVKGINETAQAYNKQLKGEILLQQSAKVNPYLNGKSVSELQAFASELQNISVYGDEELIPMMAQLASQGRTQAEIMDIMKASVDLASTGIVSLDSAVQSLNLSYSGQIGRLGMVLPALKDLTAEELKSGKAVDYVKKQYDGMSESTAKAVDSYTQMKNAAGDYKEAVGLITKPASDAWNHFWKGWYESGTAKVKALNDFLEGISSKLAGKALSSSISKNIKDFNVEGTERTVEVGRELRSLSYEQVQDIEKYLASLKKRNEIEEIIYQRAKTLNESRKTQEGDLNKLRDEQQKKLEAQKKAEEERQRAIQATAEEYNKLESFIDKYGAKALDESEESLRQLIEQLELLKKSGNLTEEQLNKVDSAIGGINEAIDGIKADKMAASFNVVSEILGTIADGIGEVRDSFGDLVDSLSDYYDMNQADDLDNLNKQYTEGLISYEDYIRGKEELDKEYAEKKYKLQVAEWALQLAQATANIAQGVAAALTGVPPASYINAASTAVLGAAQIATIVANKPRKAFANGGIVGASMGADNSYAQVRNGEMILNAQQQLELWKTANGMGSGGAPSVYLPINIENNSSASVNASVNEHEIKITVDEIVRSSLRQGSYDSALSQQQANSNGRTIL